jgi:hypothetical protein
VAARGSAPVLGALCIPPHPAREADEPDQDKGPAVSDQDRITSREVKKPGGWTFSVGYRFQPSSRHFVGTVEQKQREIANNQIQNVYHLLDIGVEHRVSGRFSVSASVPLVFAYRNQLYAPKAEYRVRGIGDMTVGTRGWLFQGKEGAGNMGIGVSLKLPTGKDNSMGAALDSKGQPVLATADQSIQAGDGGVGFSLDTQAYRPVWLGTMVYFTATYLFNPRDTNGVATFRTKKGETVMSVSDQYLVRGGIAHAIPGIPGLVVTFGGRWEGVPVRDLLGKSNGFRRPGYAISGDPGFLLARWGYVFACNVPWAIERNRRRSVADIQYGGHGDAAFADYALTLGVSRTF